MDCGWKPNWAETRQRFAKWWDRDGLLLGMWGAPLTAKPHESVVCPSPAVSVEAWYVDARTRALRNHHEMARRSFPADTVPIGDTNMGAGSLAFFIGCEPGFAKETVWFKPWREGDDHPEKWPSFRFDPGNPWWALTEMTMRECRKLANGKYAVGCPDLVEGVDILASLRGPQTLMIDLIERPDWVSEKVFEINQVWFEAYQRIYDIIKLEDGSAIYDAFRICGLGKTAKLQCDASAMFSPEMFARFVVPGLTEQCEWLDHSMYHLDGTQCICHLDHLLQIESLNAIEWTPQAGIEQGGSPRWFDLYRRILKAGKSVQAINVSPDEIIPLLDAVGGKGVYILTTFDSVEHAETMMKKVESYG